MANIDYTKIKTLLVDDVALNIKVVEKMISPFKFQIRTASNGEQALKAIAEEQPDLILLDLMMPIMDGFETLQRIRAGEAGDPNVLILILSALNSEKDIIRGMNLGANDFITKPVIMQRLNNVIEKHLQEKFKD
ncbi:MAG: response regulator [Bacteroidales bacterium]|jgi:CheY-like chemotaxis protein|nr:response regulator [Bacteroidales bacterium]MBR3114836.1 response regulator [Bacteroidaceae bacterium]MBR3372944.1 response regulator [Bacteroidaceae bacterium]MBR3633618.1 response regulator [Bacteroidaceae bacterium]MBR3733545.1 response regulator [Bacteroidaceae bacterium]